MSCAHFLIWVALAANPDLERAHKLVADLQYSEAKGALEAALKRQGNDRDTLLRIYELQGVVLATLNDAARATKAFGLLLVLDPDAKPPADQPPRVTTPFYEARGHVSEVGHLEARRSPPVLAAGRVAQVALEVTSDPLKLVRRVRFHLRADGGAWAVSLATPSGGAASTAVSAARLQWWAELLGERDAVLLELGSMASPTVEESGAPVAASDGLKRPEPASEAPTATAVSGASPKTASGGRVAAVVGMGLGLGSLGTAVGLGVMADGLRRKIDGAPTDADGNVIGITQRQAYAYAAQLRTFATAANVLYAVGGAVLAGSVVLFVVSGSSSSGTATLLPTGDGLALAGTW